MTDLEFDSNEKAEEAQLHAWIFFFSLKVQKLRKTGCRPKIFPPPGKQSDDVILFNPQAL